MFSEPVRSAFVGRAKPALLRAHIAPRAPLVPVRDAPPPSLATLLTGEWCIVERVERGHRVHLRARQQSPVMTPTQASRKDGQARAALDLAARGAANKVIALELGFSQSTVTRMIARALQTLQLADVREAMALAQTEPVLTDGTPATCTWSLEGAPRCDWENLTAAERDIVERLMRHGTRAAIARARGTSLFTVNSQLATIFAKLRVSSKRELMQLAASRAATRA